MAADGSLKFDTKINMEGFESGISTLTKAVDRLTGVIEKLSGRLVTQLNGAGTAAKSTSEQVDTIGEAAEDSEAKVKRLREQMDAISVHTMEENAKESTTSLPSSTMVGQNSMLYDPKAMAAVFGEAAAEIQTYSQAVEKYGNQAASSMNSSEGKIADAAMFGSEKTRNAYSNMKEAVVNAFRDIPSILGRIPKMAAREFSKIPGIVKSVFSAAGGSVAKFGKSLGNALANSVRQATSRLKGLGKTSNGVSKSILKLSNMFKLMLIRMAMRAAIQGVKKGMENLVQYSSDVNRSMSGLMSSMTYLKNNFAASFAPILTTVAPILNTLINLLSTAAGYLNQFFSALSGGSTFIRAKKINEDYAKSLKATGSAAKKAGKDAKNALAPFDELNMIVDSKESGAGSGGPDPSKMFETVGIDKGINDFAKKLKQLFSAQDWSGIGSLIGEQINNAVQRFTDYIHWDNIGSKITEFLSAFTTLFNTLVSKIDWYGIGIMMGTGINTLANALYLLLTQIDWTLLGAAIAQGVNGMVATVDWNLVGRTIGAYFQAQISGLYGFVSTADWPAIGQAIGESLNGVVSQIDWVMLGKLLAEGLSGAFATLGNFATTFDWSGFGSSLASSISTFFQNFDWAGAGTAISDIVIGLLDALITLITKTDWAAFGEGIATSLENIDWNGIVSRLFKVIGAALGGLAAFLGGLLSDGIAAAQKYFEGKIDECGGNIVAGILKGILDAIKGIGEWIVTNIFKPFMDGFKDAFGIHSPSTAMAEMGRYLWDGFCNGIKKFFSSPSDFIKQYITNPFLNGVKNLLGIHSPSTVLSGIGENTVAGFNEGVEGSQKSTQSIVQSWAKGIAGWFTDRMGISSSGSKESKEWADSTMDGYNNAVSQNYTKSQSVMEKWASSVKDWFWGASYSSGSNGMYQEFQTMAKRINEGFAEGITAFSHLAKEAIQKWAGEIIASAKSELDIHSPSREAYSIAKYFVEGFNNGMASMLDSSVGAAQKWLNGVSGVFDGAGIRVPVGLDIPNAGAYLPRMASGSIVPPRAGESATSRSGNMQDGNAGLLMAFKGVMQEFQGNGISNITIPVYLDSVRIHQSVVKQNRKGEWTVGDNPLAE